MNLRHRSTTTAAVLAVGALALAGRAAEETAAAPAAPTDSALTITDPWVKAAEEGMSAAFGELTNYGDEDVTIVSAESDASSMLELHETVDDGSGTMMMQEVDGGFTVGAGETVTLEPGGDHIMFMDLTDPLEAGEEVTVTLTLSDGSTVDLTAPVKDYSGANESYSGGEDMESTGEHEGHEGH